MNQEYTGLTLDTVEPITLVELHEKAQFERIGQVLHNALPFYFDHFKKEGVKVYTINQSGTPVFALSVLPAGYTEHIVGDHNRAPTQDEMAIITQLLTNQGIENRYNPKTIS